MTDERELAMALPDPLHSVPRHDGGPWDPEAAFFVPPPAAIGPVLSAHSTLSRAAPLRGADSRRKMAARLCLGTATLLLLATALPPVPLIPTLLILLAVGLLSAACANWLTRLTDVVTYVGRDGLARYRRRAGAGERIEESVLCFRTAQALRTNHPAALDYPPQAADWYGFAWFDAGGRMLFRIAGWWLGPHGPADQAFHFGVAAEEAWTLYRLNACADELSATGRIAFPLALGGKLQLGRGVLELAGSGGLYRWDREQQPLVVPVDRQLRLHFGVVNAQGESLGLCTLSLREAADACLILVLLRTLVLFDLSAVEGAETHWDGRNFPVTGTGWLTDRPGRADPYSGAFQERSLFTADGGRLPRLPPGGET